MTTQPNPVPIPFKAETRQLLDILIHSLYTEREVFLRELISNAADALTRMNFEMLTNRMVLDPEAELAIWITVNKDEKTLTIRDTGIGMTAEELAENLGTIAHSGARAFLDAVQQNQSKVSDIIGQFGVGFYSAFMAAEAITVASRTYQPDGQAAQWFSSGDDTYTVEPAEKADRGTVVKINLKEDAIEFADESKLKEIIQRHSDYIPYPIYLGETHEQANRQTALWRQNPRQVEEKAYHDFYKQLTLEFEPPLSQIHLVIDAPVQLYALLFVPGGSERGIFSTRKKDGLKLYARKVLIQEYCTDLLPEYLRFMQGIVDSEDLPLNVSRESVHSTRIMAQLKKVITSRVIENLKTQGQEQPDVFEKFWGAFGRAIKEGIATDPDSQDTLVPLLRYHTLNHQDKIQSLEDYVKEMKADQKAIYYILGDDERSVIHSPHLEIFRKHGLDVLIMADPLDSFALLRLTKFKEIDLVSVSSVDLKLPDLSPLPDEQSGKEEKKASEAESQDLITRFKGQLGERVADVRLTDRLVESPARLVDKEGSFNAEMQRVYRLLNREYQVPQKVLEINPEHPILMGLAQLEPGAALEADIIEQVYENALLIEGLHPDPAGMIERIQHLMKAALNQ